MHTWAWWPTVVVVVVATVTDLRSRKIPNWLVFPFLLAGVVVATYMRGWAGIGHSLAGVGLAALICGAVGMLGGIGMGDVKLCAAIGAWIGPGQLLTALVLTGIVGGLMALAWSVAGGFLGSMLTNTWRLVRHLGTRGLRPHPELVLSNPRTRKMPYAPAIAIGTLASFFAR